MSRDVRNPSPAYNTSCPSILMIASSVPTRSTFLLPTQPFSPKSSALKFDHSLSFFPPTRSTQISPRATLSTPIPLPNPHHNQSLFPGYPVHTQSRPPSPSLPLPSPSPPPTPSPKPSILPYTLQPSVNHHAHILSPANVSSSLRSARLTTFSNICTLRP